MDLFTGTAQYYDDYRPGVPQNVIDTVMGAVNVPVTLLDLGCGTGRITEQFAPLFDEIVGVEPDTEMAKFARQRLQPYNARIIRSHAEDAHFPDDWQASLTIICRAFHWMDRRVVLSRLESVVASDGVIAILADHSFWEMDEPWTNVVREVLQEYLGAERRTVKGTFKDLKDPFGVAVAASSFKEMQSYEIPLVRTWSIDQIIGYLYSTSYASHAVLGDKAPAFEKHLRGRLAALSPEGIFTENNRFEILMAQRPQI
jgi:ubiquinone/menaquinone biosynthesis C-methylase UbiE